MQDIYPKKEKCSFESSIQELQPMGTAEPRQSQFDLKCVQQTCACIAIFVRTHFNPI